MKNSLIILYALSLSVIISCESQAETNADTEIVNRGADPVFDYGVPSSPAERLINVAVDKISPSTSLKPFILSIPKILSDKNQGQSVGLSLAPTAFLFR